MNLGYFHYPLPANEPVKSYAPGSPEKDLLKKALTDLKSAEHDIPAIIDGKEIRSGNKIKMRPPHELSHSLGYFHRSSKDDVKRAIDAALKIKSELGVDELGKQGRYFSESCRPSGRQIPLSDECINHARSKQKCLSGGNRQRLRID